MWHYRLHGAGVFLAVWVFGQRTWQFLDLVLEGSTNLIGSIFERLFMLSAALVWHLWKVDRWEPQG